MKYILHTDGGARGNPGPAAIGVVIENIENGELTKLGSYIGETTNNVAEYKALIAGLQAVMENSNDPAKDDLECFLDSELVVRQLNGEYKVKNSVLRQLFNEVGMLGNRFNSIKYRHVKRSENGEADNLVNRALDARE